MISIKILVISLIVIFWLLMSLIVYITENEEYITFKKVMSCIIFGPFIFIIGFLYFIYNDLHKIKNYFKILKLKIQIKNPFYKKEKDEQIKNR